MERAIGLFEFEADLEVLARSSRDEVAIAMRMSLEYLPPLQP